MSTRHLPLEPPCCFAGLWSTHVGWSVCGTQHRSSCNYPDPVRETALEKKTVETGCLSHLVGGRCCSVVGSSVPQFGSVVARRLPSRAELPRGLQVTKVQRSEHVRQFVTESRQGLSVSPGHGHLRTIHDRRSRDLRLKWTASHRSTGHHSPTSTVCRSFGLTRAQFPQHLLPHALESDSLNCWIGTRPATQ